MKYLIAIVMLFTLVGCSQSEATESAPATTAQMGQLDYKLVSASYEETANSQEPKGKWVHVVLRVTNTAEPIWFSWQWHQLKNADYNFNYSTDLAYQEGESALSYMTKDQWKEGSLWFDIPEDQEPTHIVLRNGKDKPMVMIELDITNT